ncbi:MAG: hypothetical protein Ta2G_08040 [Termitinemataceae bacterium]|nr:MAG: hypothetical protein Ta2G_08040 [Termitinemataceae bacterium]
MKYVYKGALIFFLAIFLSFCSRAEPSVAYSFMQLVLYEDAAGNFVPHITFFVLATDDDGVEDIDEIRLYNDFEGLMWKVRSDEWTLLADGTNTWIGTKDFVMPASESVPNGEYRVVVIDKGGDQGSRTFGFDGVSQNRYPNPKLTIADGMYTIESLYPKNSFLCYNASGEYRNTFELSSKTGIVANLPFGGDIISVSLWAQDSENSISALTRQKALR